MSGTLYRFLLKRGSPSLSYGSLSRVSFFLQVTREAVQRRRWAKDWKEGRMWYLTTSSKLGTKLWRSTRRNLKVIKYLLFKIILSSITTLKQQKLETETSSRWQVRETLCEPIGFRFAPDWLNSDLHWLVRAGYQSFMSVLLVEAQAQKQSKQVTLIS